MKMKTTTGLLGFAAAVLIASTVGSLSEDILPPDSLKGSVWAAEATHDRVTVDSTGKISVKEGKNIYIEFIDLVGGIYPIKIHWWNVSANINVIEYAVLLPHSENVFDYAEAEHAPDGGFPGIQGGGTFRLVDESTAELTQYGNLLDRSASAFVTRLKRVDAPPEVPIAQTYPPPS